MSRRVYLLGWGLALVAGAFLLTDALLWRPGVTERNVRRIRTGMTLAEVQTILGEHGRRSCLSIESYAIYTWGGDDGIAIVSLDVFAPGREAVRAADFDFRPGGRPPPLARLRAWLGW